jgi:mannosyl-glycoprotein endo-beta-N-acetylglucosaminidase
MSSRKDSSFNSILGTSMTRRHALRTFATAGAAMAAIATMGRATANHTSEPYTVTANANFRTGPGTSHSIISVIPTGATFTLNAQEQNNYYSVNYKGTNGWVYAPLIVPVGSTTPDPVIVGEARASTAVNLRSGPSTSNSVLRVVSSGTWVQVSNTVQNGFRYVVHQGLAGWMADQYLVWSNDNGGETFTTTANLNLRAEPSTSARVLLVMPSGSTVKALSGTSPGWRQVSYNGTTGWASTNYLN